MSTKMIKRGTALIGVGGIILAGLGVGTAVAAVSGGSEVRAIPVAEGSAVSKLAAPDFKTNERGHTYGSIAEVNGQAVEPDLISALATNGSLGYVSNAELKAAEGHPSLFKSPEEALKWQESRGNGAVSIPVYKSDGVTRLGEFVIQPATGAVGTK
jgi:hypothetical protein